MKIIDHITKDHKHLLPHVAQIKVAADAVGAATDSELRKHLDTAHNFLAHHLIPHAAGEDRVLYPLVGKYMGSPQATATMTREHQEVAELTARLGRMSPASGSAELRDVLYSLHALVSLHFKKEEEIFLPVLEANLTQADDDAAAAALHEEHIHE